MRRLCIAAVLLALGASRADTAQIAFHIDRHGGARAGFVLTLAPMRVTSQSHEAGTAPVRRAVSADEQAVALDLDSGQWYAEVEGGSLWHARRYFTVAGDGDVTLDLWPAGTLRGAVTTTSKPRPAELIVRFEGKSARGEPLSGETTCAIGEGGFNCTLPAGTFDLRLRARRHVARYFLSVRIAEGDARDIGTFELRQGQSILGRVELPSRSRADVAKTVIRAKVTGVHDGGGTFVAGAPLLGVTATAEKNGLFHLDGVMPGQYVVSASHPDHLFSDEIEVPVRLGLETEINEPLRLSQPRRIKLSITPSLTPEGKQWRVRIDRTIGPNQLARVSESSAQAGGVWLSPPLQPAHYAVSVGTGEGDVWYDEAIAVGTADEERHPSITGQAVSGRVSLGGKPLQASVIFGDHTGRRAATKSNDDGELIVTLPGNPGELWDVTVQSSMPAVHYTAHGMSVKSGEPIVIDLPGTVLMGSVIDDHGAPVPHALLTIVSLKPGESPIQPSAAADGTFAVYGLAGGAYRIAATGPNEESQPVTVEFHPEESDPPVTIVAHKRQRVRGRVVSPLGPVAGVIVAIQSSRLPVFQLQSSTTGADGTFALTVPPGEQDLDVMTAAPGFVYALNHLHYEPGSEISVEVGQYGGTLVLDAQSGGSLFLAHDGATIPLSLLGLQWPVGAEPLAGGATQYRVPMMEPGGYALCSVSGSNIDLFRQAGGASGADRCSRGWLDPMGSLTLSIVKPAE